MPSPYFINVDPASHKLRMFFGRRQEIQAIRDYLMNGDSVLLIGERRIGKTFLMYMIGDFAKGGVESCKQLLDRQAGVLLAELRYSTASWRWPYVDMLAITSASGLYFRILTELAEEQAERLAVLVPIDHTVFLRELTKLSEGLSRRRQRAVVLVDESEKLLSLDESAQVLSCLKAVVQQCDSIDFVLAGDFKPHQETLEFINLKGALRPLHLGPLEPTDATALILMPVEGQLSFEEQALQRVLELTGCRPGLIQILCDHLYESVMLERPSPSYVTLAELDRLWESKLRSRVFESFEAVLKDFFEGLQGDERSIFAFLAHQPSATEDEIASTLHIQPVLVRRGLQSLQVAHRIEYTGTGYCIGAKLVEEFGSRFAIPPVIEIVKVVNDQSSGVQTLQDLIAQDESSDLEFKSSLRWDYNRNTVHKDVEEAAIKTIAAFLNTGGGTLVIGVDDERHVLGLANDCQSFRKKDRDGFELHLMTLISNSLGKNVCCHVHPAFHIVEGSEVCRVKVEACPFPVYAGGDAIFYIRTGNQTQILNPKEAVEYVKYHWGKP
jgi:hypothetical protein